MPSRIAQRDVRAERSVLLVAHVAPPSPLSSARRIAGFAKYLGALGYEITVLTSVLSGTGPIEGARRVIQTRELMASRFNWRRANWEALQAGDSSYASAPHPIARVVVPDLALVTWLPFALPRALGLHRGHRFDCVITSSPPASIHIIGRALRARGLPWIADLRDGWTFEPGRQPWPVPGLQALDEWLERRCLSRADAVTAVTAPIVTDLEIRGVASAGTITNGYDPDDSRILEADGPPTADLLDKDRHSLVYTGRLSYVGRSPKPMLDGLRELKRSAPEIAGRLEVVFAGPLAGDEREQLEDPELTGLVRWVGSLEREDSLQLQRSADSLLLLTTGQRGETGQKLYEYLAAQRPVFVVGEQTEAARMVRAAGAGMVAPMNDAARLASALRELVEAPPVPTAVAAGFGYPSLARQMAERIEQVCRGG